MSGPQKYRLLQTKTLEKELKKFRRAHYRKNRGAGDECVELIVDLIEAACMSPDSNGGHPEPLPGGVDLPPGVQFWKVEFRVPGQRGARGQGRLMYLTDNRTGTLKLVKIYTHHEYPKRPPAGALERLVKAAEQEEDMPEEHQAALEPEQ